ncbi:MAG: FKBP-type peptidyl-prolyl cis-trans isomerase [Bacteroidota bacterium]
MLQKLITFILLAVLAASCKTDVTDYGPIDKKTIEAYLAANNLTAQSTASGLYYIIEKPGGVNHPTINSSVAVNYKGYLTDGTVFDASYSSGTPANFALNALVAGWQEGLQLIGLKGKIKLLIPSALGYGSTAKTGIPANSVLIFDIELVEFY